MAILYRSMRVDADGKPLVASTARSLGVRRDSDIPVDEDGMVEPGLGGMSVTPDDPHLLPRHRRPYEYEGTGEDPLWSLDEGLLDGSLFYRPDDDDPPIRHGIIEPGFRMTFEEYRLALAETRDLWRKCP